MLVAPDESACDQVAHGKWAVALVGRRKKLRRESEVNPCRDSRVLWHWRHHQLVLAPVSAGQEECREMKGALAEQRVHPRGGGAGWPGS